jgi:hypothetical protein
MQPNTIITPNPQDVTGPTVIVSPGSNITLEFNFSKVFINTPSLLESVVSATYYSSSDKVAAISRSVSGYAAIITLSNTLTPGEIVSVNCNVTGSLGTQSGAYCWINGLNSF